MQLLDLGQQGKDARGQTVRVERGHDADGRIEGVDKHQAVQEKSEEEEEYDDDDDG